MSATRSWLVFFILLLAAVPSLAAEDAGARAERIVDEVRQLKDAGKQHEASALLQRTQWEYEAAVQKDPNDALSRFGLAMILHHQHQTPEASAHLQRALELQPRNADMHCFRGKVLAMDNKPVEAEQALRRAMELAPNDLDIQEFYAFWLASVKRFPEATNVLRKFLEADPNNKEAPLLLASVLLAQDKHAEWEETLRAAIARHPQKTELRDFLASGFYWQKRFDEAYAERLQIKRINPADADNEAHLLNLCKFLTRPEPTKPHLDRIYELHRAGKIKGNSFTREEFYVRNTRVETEEYFEIKERMGLKYRFVVMKDDKPEYMISVSSIPGAKEFLRGEPLPPDSKQVFSVDVVRDESFEHFGMFPLEMTYEQSRALVTEIIDGKRTPRFTRNETVEREQKTTTK